MIRDEPERGAVEESPYRGAPRLPGDAAGGLQHYLAGQPPENRVGEMPVKEADPAAFAVLRGGMRDHDTSIVETVSLVNGWVSLQAVTLNRRAHTGSRRNDAAELAILGAAAELLAAGEGALITVAAIAERAGVGKQTIYRWWPSKSAVLLDAMVHRAQQVAPTPDTGDLQSDLRVFFRSTFSAAGANRSLLLGVLREALGDAATMDRLARFTEARRDEMAQILQRASGRGQVPGPDRHAAVIDQAFGLLWYRMIFVHEALDEQAADDLAAALTTQLCIDQEG
jgi:AcrR family transcriptional regulator